MPPPPGVRDSEAYRAALARQTVIRDSITRLLDRHRLDALAYPTMRRRPVLIGDPQAGSTCELSAHTGLPALSLPAGFTEDGLPVGLELLGRAFADARLLAMAYSFERSGPRRRAPVTTPALTGGRAPPPFAFAVTAGPATGRFRFDPSRFELHFDVRASGIAGSRLYAMVLQREKADQPRGVVQRLTGPGTPSASGAVRLPGADVQALLRGELWLAVFTDDQKEPYRARLVVR